MKIGTVVGAPDLETPPLGLAWGPNLDHTLGSVAKMGFDGVELMLKNAARLDSRRIQRLLDKHGLELVELCSGHVYGEDRLGLIGPDPENCKRAMERMKALVDFGADFGSGTKLNIGRTRGRAEESDMEGSWQRLKGAFQELADYALPKGVKLLLEPVNHYEVNCILTTQDGIRMCRDVDRPNFGLLLDVYHMNIEDVDIYESLREASPYLWHVHFSDNNRKWPGNAHLDFPRIIRTLRAIGYDQYVSFEAFPEPDPETAARRTLAYLRRYIPEKP